MLGVWSRALCSLSIKLRLCLGRLSIRQVAGIFLVYSLYWNSFPYHLFFLLLLLINFPVSVLENTIKTRALMNQYRAFPCLGSHVAVVLTEAMAAAVCSQSMGHSVSSGQTGVISEMLRVSVTSHPLTEGTGVWRQPWKKVRQSAGIKSWQTWLEHSRREEKFSDVWLLEPFFLIHCRKPGHATTVAQFFLTWKFWSFFLNYTPNAWILVL